MTMTKSWEEQGGSAFPIPHSNEAGAPVGEHGMSLRDWFAGQVMAGINANPVWDEHGWSDRAKSSYEAADAMLEARK